MISNPNFFYIYLYIYNTHYTIQKVAFIFITSYVDKSHLISQTIIKQPSMHRFPLQLWYSLHFLYILLPFQFDLHIHLFRVLQKFFPINIPIFLKIIINFFSQYTVLDRFLHIFHNEDNDFDWLILEQKIYLCTFVDILNNTVYIQYIPFQHNILSEQLLLSRLL